MNQFGTYCIHRTQFIEYIHFVTLFAICMQKSVTKLNYKSQFIRYPRASCVYVRCACCVCSARYCNHIGQVDHKVRTQHIHQIEFREERKGVVRSSLYSSFFYLNTIVHRIELNTKIRSFSSSFS